MRLSGGACTYLGDEWDLMRNLGPLKLTGIIGVLEIVAWAALGYAKVWLVGWPLAGKEAISLTAEAVSYAADHFGELVLGLSTTAYVIFTYFLLQDAVAQRKRAAEPYLTLRWFLSDQPTSERMPAFRMLAQRSRDWLVETFGTQLDLDSLTSAAPRYVHLEIQSIWDTSISWFNLAISASASVPGRKAWSSRDQLEKRNLGLGKGQNALLTVLDLGAIPTTASVSVRIDSLVYGPAEAGIRVVEFAGDRNFGAKGTWVPTETGFAGTR